MSIAVPEQSLDGLAEIVNREHALVEAAVADALTHAIRAGVALLEVRGRIERGEWTRWLAENFSGSLSTANNYVRFAYFQEALKSAGVVRVHDALQLLRVIGATRIGERGGPGALPRYDTALREEARRLRALGHSQTRIGEELGVPQPTISYWLNPEKTLARRREWMRKRRAANRALQQVERKRAAVAAKGDIAETYSLVRRLAEALERASMNEQDNDARKALVDALHRLYKVEDRIVAAIGTSKPKEQA